MASACPAPCIWKPTALPRHVFRYTQEFYPNDLNSLERVLKAEPAEGRNGRRAYRADRAGERGPVPWIGTLTPG